MKFEAADFSKIRRTVFELTRTPLLVRFAGQWLEANSQTNTDTEENRIFHNARPIAR